MMPDIDLLRVDLEYREALLADGNDIGSRLYVHQNVAARLVGQSRSLGSASRVFEEADFGPRDGGILFVRHQTGDSCCGCCLGPGCGRAET